RYDFEVDGRSTAGLPRGADSSAASAADGGAGLDCLDPAEAEPARLAPSDHAPGRYAEKVRQAREAFLRGDLFEVVLSQTFRRGCSSAPSRLFRYLREHNPAPYGFLANLGQGEHLVGASPEMFVRVEGSRIETCPISGTIGRQGDALEDARRVRELLDSAKDECELTMCTDVDRNDKSRVCRPGSVRVIGRRQIELTSRLIHTVDHVEGQLRPGLDALDAFLAHAWAVTVTGAPKPAALQFIEDHEESPRGWYGGAVGWIGFDGRMNTGLTLRTIRLENGQAEVRAGATLLYDSDPEAEERETYLKASAMLQAIGPPATALPAGAPPAPSNYGRRARPARQVLVVDHRDSFVHTLASYFQQAGATVATMRSARARQALAKTRPDLLVLSPGPGRPADFDIAATLDLALALEVPVFGVCLGLQGLVEYFGGTLGTLASPVHGKASTVRVLGGRLFDGLPGQFAAGRYHSLFAIREHLPAELKQTADSEDGLVMAVEHVRLPLAAVQFHPESLLTLGDEVGLRLIRNVLDLLPAGHWGAGPSEPALSPGEHARARGEALNGD
ncbi:MAG: anthranilate synthase component I, partial [Chloroflexota bacterium]